MKPVIVSVRLYRECEDDAQLIKHLEIAFAGEKRSGGKGKVLRKIFHNYFKGQNLPLVAAPRTEREIASNVVTNNASTVAEQAITNNEDWENVVMDFATQEL